MESTDLKVSVITVCLNSEETIESTMKSVLRQTWQNIEYIVIDGGSHDRTADIIRKYEEHISFWCSEPDHGIYDAMNKGLGHASGDLVGFLNSGDSYLDDAVERMAAAYSGGGDILYGDYILLDGSASIARCGRATTDDLHVYMAVCHQAMFSKRELFDLYGLFTTEYKIAADYEWLLRVLKKGADIRYVPGDVCYFLAGGTSMVQGAACAEEVRQIACNALETVNEKEKYMLQIQEHYHKTVQAANSLSIAGYLLDNNKDMFQKIIYNFLIPGETVIIFGSGIYGNECIKWCEAADIQIAKIVDNNQSKWGTFVGKYKISDPGKWNLSEYRIIIAIKKYEDQIIRQLLDWGFEKGRSFLCISDILDAFKTEQQDTDKMF